MRRIAFAQVLSIVSFRYLWLAQLFSQIGINLIAFVLALRVYDLTHKNTAVSVLTLAFVIPAAVFGTLAGVVVDRYDKKIVLFLCNLARAVIVLGFLFTSESIIFVVGLAFLVSLVTQFFVPAEAPAISTLVPGPKLLTANGLFTVTIFATLLSGGLFAGPFLDMFGINGTIIIISLMYFLAAFFISRIPGQTVASVIRRHVNIGRLAATYRNLSFRSLRKLQIDFHEGLDYLRGHKRALFAVLLLVGSQAVVASSSTLLPGFADRVLHIPVNDASVLLMGPAILGILSGAVFMSQFGQRLWRGDLVNGGIFLVGAMMFLLGVVRSQVGVQLILFVLGFANGMVDVSANTSLQSETQESIRSRVYGIQTALAGAVFIVPMMLSGGFSDLFGVAKVFMAGGILIVAAWLFKIREYVARFA